jgi:hypothetical protein
MVLCSVQDTFLLLSTLNFRVGAYLIGIIGALVMGKDPTRVLGLASTNASGLNNCGPMEQSCTMLLMLPSFCALP